MPPPPRRPRAAAMAATAVAGLLAVTACTGTADRPGPSGTTPQPGRAGTPLDAGSTAPSAAPTAGSPLATSSSPAPDSPAAPDSPRAPGPATATGPDGLSTCADVLLVRLTPQQRAGQLLMVGAQAGQPVAGVEQLVRDHRAGGVVLLGTWVGAGTVRAAAERWQRAGREASGGLGLLVAADQEGGAVQHLRGPGFTSIPSAVAQGRSPAVAGPTAARVGAELRSAGVNVALAPVADTVPAGFAPRNAPIGAYGRQYGSDPGTVSTAVTAVVAGLRSGGVAATLKHFPGLGRVTGNTDLTADGTTDETTTADDAYLGPFRAGVDAGAGLVMVSSARYSRIDPANRAVFSRAVLTGMLRERLGFAGVVVSDDLGVAAAVASVPVGERATRFVAAGGDIVLTGAASTVSAMVTALTGKAAAEPAFAAQVDAAVRRVVELKVRQGLAGC